MKKPILLTLLLSILLLSLTACNLPTVTPPGETPTETATSTELVVTATQVPPTSTEQAVTSTPTQVLPTYTPSRYDWKGVFVYDMNEFAHQVQVIMPDGLNPLGTLERHVMPTDPYTTPHSFLPFYIACNYFTTSNESTCVDNNSSLIGGDSSVPMGRPEYKIDVFRGDGEYTTQLFSDGRPMKAGWQARVVLPEYVEATKVTITVEVQIWTNPLFTESPPYNIIEHSKPAILPENDDIRVVEFFTFIADSLYMRQAQWIKETYYGDPTAESWDRFSQSEEQFIGLSVEEMPYDQWKSYTSIYNLTDVSNEFYFGLGVLSRFGWGTNFYVRSITVEVDGYAITVIPTEQPFATPTPIGPITTTPEE